MVAGQERGGRHHETDIRSELETNKQLYQVLTIILIMIYMTFLNWNDFDDHNNDDGAMSFSHGIYFQNKDVRPPFTYAALIKQVFIIRSPDIHLIFTCHSPNIHLIFSRYSLDIYHKTMQ